MLGFVNGDSVPRQHCMDSASLLHGAVDSEAANKAVVALVVAMNEVKYSLLRHGIRVAIRTISPMTFHILRW